MPDLDFKRLLLPARADAGAFFRGDWILNLYRGCNHGCIYCDSRSVCYHMEDFDRVHAKRDCLAALETELRCKRRAGVVSMGAASDAYNAREAALGVTRGALALLKRYGFGIFLATKSAMVARDADLL
ncbi:MAG: radical SAM protein, partial [Clostridia bacterium]|nr:radical SAM protein [Clostridia bacterium]